MNTRNHIKSQPIHNNISCYNSYPRALPPVSEPYASTFDEFISMQQQPQHCYDHNPFGVFASQSQAPITSLADIPPVTNFNYNPRSGAMHNDNDHRINYNPCARMNVFDPESNIRHEMDFGCFNPEFQAMLPPVVDNVAVSCDNNYCYHPLACLDPHPIHHFRSDEQSVSHPTYEDDLSSTSCTSFNGTIKQSPSLASHPITTETPKIMTLADPSMSVIKKRKKEEKQWVCEWKDCGKRYKYKSSMKLHYRVHTKDASVCKECGKKFPHEHKLRVHMRSHTGERPYKCTVCTKAFSDKSNLNRHKRLHTGEKPYECEFCQRRYSDSSALVDHRRRKHTKEKPYECHSCHKRFAASSDLTSHEAVHSQTRPYKCDQCNKKFKRKSDVHKHKKTHQPKY